MEQGKTPPIIIGGCGRSGTTLLQAVLGAHPSVYAIPEETGFFCPGAYLQPPPPDAPIGSLDLFRARFLSAMPESKARWSEKTPKNIHFFRKILDLFGQDVRLIQVIRDGRDVVLSRHPLDYSRHWVSPERWIESIRAGLPFSDHPQVATVRYEDLVLDFDETMRRLSGFLELPPYDFSHWRGATPIRQDRAFHGSVTQDIHSRAVRKWEKALPTEDMRSLDAFMENAEAVSLLRQLGYRE